MVPGASTEPPDLRKVLRDHAPALFPLAEADPSLLDDVAARPLDRDEDPSEIHRRFADATAGLGDGPELHRVLRRLRHREVVRIALREVLRLADIERTSAEMAALAAAAIDAALAACRRDAEAAHGRATDPEGAPIPLVVLGMGKLGGNELNLGSDVDLCFFYGTDDGTLERPGDKVATVHQAFARIAMRTARALSEPTEDGFVFRVDLRLRPEGQQGPLVNSLASAERYYESFGRTWERAALLRAQPIAGDLALGHELLDALRPFVFRRAVDPGIPHELAELLRRSRRELRVDEARDVKLGRGGIREAEWVVQALQLVWGGRHRELQVAGTMDALRRLHRAGLVTDHEAETLGAAWALLRRVEHRIHVTAGYQTHELPLPGEELDRFGQSLGYADGAALATAVDAARARVAALFASLLEGETAAPAAVERLCDLVAFGATAPAIAERVPEVFPGIDPDEAASHLTRLARHATAPLGPVTRDSSPTLGPLLLREVAESADPGEALRWLAEFFSRLGGPWPYERLLVERPRLTRRLVGLFGASATLSAALVGHPEDIDLLLGAGGSIPTPEEIRGAHDEIGSEVDPERLVVRLRHLKRDATLRIGLAHAADELPLDAALALLSELAEAQVRAACAYAFAERTAALGHAPELVVSAMGKLGGRELGFGGDLDLIFLHGRGAPDVYAKIAQRIMGLLSQPDAEGPGYQTDTRLRPSGSHGMLVVSLAAFDAYHASQAGAWERLALIRARPIAGDPRIAGDVAERFARLAFEGEPIDPVELAALRRRIEHELAGEKLAGRKTGRYHAKLGHGGLVDVEFAVQSLQARHGRDPRLRVGGTLEALQALRHAGHVTARDAATLAEGYAFFRSVEQAVKLVDDALEPVLVRGGALAPRIARRLRLAARDGQAPAEVLFASWERHAAGVRDAFERLVAPVGLPGPQPRETR